MKTPPPPVLVLKGEPRTLGRQQGVALSSQIHANVAALLGDFLTGTSAVPRETIRAWQQRLRTFCFDEWPWLQDEIQGIAEGAGLDRELAELLSFRAWQYEVYHAGACSSLAVPDAQGRVITGGTLDDPRHLYAVAQCQPTNGLRYASFPIAGTVWANRGMNEAGLALGISSLICTGVRFDLDRMVPVDLVFRHMLQFCSTVDEVAACCRKYKFFSNLVAADRSGKVFACSNHCDSHTVYQTAEKKAALTNHPIEPAAATLRARGYTGPAAGSYSVERHAQLTHWIEANAGKATPGSLITFLGATRRAEGVNNPNTAFATVAAPQLDARTLWIAQQPVQADSFYAVDVCTGAVRMDER